MPMLTTMHTWYESDKGTLNENIFCPKWTQVDRKNCSSFFSFLNEVNRQKITKVATGESVESGKQELPELSNSNEISLFRPQNLQISMKIHSSAASRAIGCKGTLAKPEKNYRQNQTGMTDSLVATAGSTPQTSPHETSRRLGSVVQRFGQINMK